MKYFALPTTVSALLLVLTACSGANTAGGETTSAGNGSGGSGGSSGDGGSSGEGGNGTTGVTVSVGSTSTGGPGSCDAADDEDRDQDGWSKAGGDCNDCDANVNPGAIEVVITEPNDEGVVPEPADEDCDGTVDNPLPATCDTGISLESPNSLDGARAIELCKDASGQADWGVVSAQYVRANGTPIPASNQHGIQAMFGQNVPPRGGASMLALSSGRARTPGQPGACNSCDCGTGQQGQAPSNQFPQTTAGCPGGPGADIYDDIALEVRLRAPTNATGFAFDFFFYTFEYPDWLCSEVNDQFIAWMQPPPAQVPNGNISFDTQGNPISVNAAFFDVCNVGPAPCSLGGAQMAGTGFDTWTGFFDDGEAGGTGWLQTQAPVTGGQEFTIRFAIWDTGDPYLDSSVLIDNFRWIANGGTVTVETEPVPDGPN